MGRKTVRLKMELDAEVHDFFAQMSHETGLSFGEILARGILAIETFRKQKEVGRGHMGFVTDRTKLDAELILFPS